MVGYKGDDNYRSHETRPADAAPVPSHEWRHDTDYFLLEGTEDYEQ